MTVPTGTAGTVTAGTVYGLSAGTVTLAASILTYTITAPAPVAAGIPIYVAFAGIINTTTAGTYTSVVTTNSAGGAVDAATTGAVVFGSSSTSVNVTVVQTLTFTSNTSQFALIVDPSMLDSAQSQMVVLTVQTNAASGYSLAASDTGLSRTLPSFKIPSVTTGPTLGVATFPASGFGISATLTEGGTDGAALAAGLFGGDFVGYPVSSANLLTATGPTGTHPRHLDDHERGRGQLHSSGRHLLRHHHLLGCAELLSLGLVEPFSPSGAARGADSPAVTGVDSPSDASPGSSSVV